MTPRELVGLLDAIAERRHREEENAALRAGLIAATIVNSNPWRRTRTPARPTDFVRRREDADYMTPEEGLAAMRAFSKAQNAGRN